MPTEVPLGLTQVLTLNLSWCLPHDPPTFIYRAMVRAEPYNLSERT